MQNVKFPTVYAPAEFALSSSGSVEKNVVNANDFA